MKEAVNRRRGVAVGDNIPVMDILHPDALHIRTRAAGNAASSVWSTWWQVASYANRIILDGEEYTGSIADIISRSGNYAYVPITGVHDIYVYVSQRTCASIVFQNNAHLEFVRFPRWYNYQAMGNKVPCDIAILNDKMSIKKSWEHVFKTIYVPQGLMERYYTDYATAIIEVNYNIIED